MIINKTEGYAIKVLGLLAEKKDIPISAKKISLILDIPYKYLARIMTKLTHHKLVDSFRGKDGGFIIARDPFLISLQDIIDIFSNESVDLCIYGNGKPCNKKTKCTLHDKWNISKQAINNSFLNITIGEISTNELNLLE